MPERHADSGPPVSALPYDRTVCACPACVAYCTSRPGYLIPSDLDRIPWLDRLRASKGALVGTRDGRRWRIGTITPAMDGGRCVFLDAEDRCTIHAQAPFGCAYFDAHMTPAAADQRSAWGLRQVQASPTYQAVRAVLVERHGEVDLLEADVRRALGG